MLTSIIEPSRCNRRRSRSRAISPWAIRSSVAMKNSSSSSGTIGLTPADHFVGAPAEDLACRCIPRSHAAVDAEVDDRDGRGVDQRAVVFVGVLDLLELRRLLEGRHRLVREGSEDLQAVRVGPQSVDRIVGPDVADPAGSPVVQRHEQPMVLPGVRPAPVELRAVAGVDGSAGSSAPLRAGAGSSPRSRTRVEATARARRRRAGRRCSGRCRSRPQPQCSGDLRHSAAARRPCRNQALPRSRCTPGRAACRHRASRSGGSTHRAAARVRRGSPGRVPSPGPPRRRSPHARRRRRARRSRLRSACGPRAARRPTGCRAAAHRSRASARRARRRGARRPDRR